MGIFLTYKGDEHANACWYGITQVGGDTFKYHVANVEVGYEYEDNSLNEHYG